MSVFLLGCLLAAGASASPTLDPHVLELKQHYEHVSYIASHPCHAPQVGTTMSVFLLGCLLAAGASASPTLDPHVLELKQHYEHVSYIASHPCHAPQVRVFPVHELFTAEQRHGKAYYPDVTVLHECSGAGSCTSGHHCVATETHPVTLPFKITFLQDMGGHEKGSWIMEYHELLNHTVCGCAAAPKLSFDKIQPSCGTSLVHGTSGYGANSGSSGYGTSGGSSGSGTISGSSGNNLGYGTSSGSSGSQLGYGTSSGSSGSQLGYGTSSGSSGYGTGETSGSQLGYGSSSSQPGYGSGSSGVDPLYTSVGYRFGDSDKEDGNSTSTTEVNKDALTFKDE